MTKRVPNIFKFSSESGNPYIFDNVSGVVFPCNDKQYNVIANYYQFDKLHLIEELEKNLNIDQNSSSAYYDFIELLIKNGFFYKKNDSVNNLVIDDKELAHASSSMLVLVVTEDCNLRCKYCVYSDKYPQIKTYSDKMMTFEVAKKAIDYYFELHIQRQQSGYKKPPMVAFYGGEPLLEFNLIKQIINYCRSKDWKPVYYITTNGTLMNQDVIDLIVNEDFMLTVSLDGDKYHNDRNRVFRTGQGTFDKIMQNLTELQMERKRRNSNQVLIINCCYDSLTDICRVADFFKEQRELFEPFYLMFNEIGRFNTTYYDDLKDVNGNSLEEGEGSPFRKLMNLIRDDLINGKQPPDYLVSILTGLLFCKNRGKGNPVFNTCMPGSKITVDPVGNYYVCERINQQIPIGDVDSKINYEKANSLIESFNNILKEHCSTCNLSRLCDICYVHLAKGGSLEFDPAVCEVKKKNIHQMLKSIYSMLEIDPKVFDVLDEFSGFEAYDILNR